jgi:hypothetical protein
MNLHKPTVSLGHTVLITEALPDLKRLFVEGLGLYVAREQPGYCELQCASQRTLALVTPKMMSPFVPDAFKLCGMETVSPMPQFLSWHCQDILFTLNQLQEVAGTALHILRPMHEAPWGKRMAILHIKNTGLWMELTE